MDTEQAKAQSAARWGDIPGGFHLEAGPDKEWRLVSGEKTCRRREGKHSSCPRKAVAEFNRRRRGAVYPYGPRDNWWAYCPEHMYGRWIEDGQVMHWRLAADEEET
jgi:hypothetical protein